MTTTTIETDDHITEKHLQFLDGVGVNNLLATCKELYDIELKELPLLSVGQMIDILQLHRNYKNILVITKYPYKHIDDPLWFVECGFNGPVDGSTLVDALWLACIKTLSEKNLY